MQSVEQGMLKSFFVPNAIWIKNEHFLRFRTAEHHLAIKHVWVPHNRWGHSGGIYFLEASNIHVELLDVTENSRFVKNYLLFFRQELCVESEVPHSSELAWHRHQRNCKGQEQERTHSSYEASEAANDEPVYDSGFEEPTGLMGFVEHYTVLMCWHLVKRWGVIDIAIYPEIQPNKLPNNLVLDPISLSVWLLTKDWTRRSGTQNIYCTSYYPRHRLCPLPTSRWSTYVLTRSCCLS